MSVDLLKLLSSPVANKIILVLLTLTIVWLAIHVFRHWASKWIHDNDVRYRTSKSISVVGYIVASMILISTLAGEFSGLSIAVGASSAGIAFALQEVIASFAGWIAISFTNFYRVGDRVQLGGIRGDVIDIGFLRTTLMEIGGWVNGDLYNGRIVRIANSFVFKEPVFNYSGDFPFLWDEIKIPVRYGSDYELARRILHEVAEEIVGAYTSGAEQRWQKLVRQYRLEDARLVPMVTLSFDDNWVTMTLRYLVDFKVRRSVQDKIFTKTLTRIESSGNRVQLASATFELVAAPPINVHNHTVHNDCKAEEPL